MAVALVTGASRGIGAACALALATSGHDVGVNYARDEPGARETLAAIEALGQRGIVIQADVSDPEAAQAMVSAVTDDLGPINSLVLNAGITRDGPAIRMDAEAWSAVIDVNLTGAFNVIRPALRGMLKQRSGSIVAISSVVGQMGNVGQANYAASKAGLVGMVLALAVESAARGVRVNAVAPGFITTDMTADLAEEHRAALLSRTPLGRFGAPEDVAAAVQFLCSEAASYVTGVVLPVDGGLLAA